MLEVGFTRFATAALVAITLAACYSGRDDVLAEDGESESGDEAPQTEYVELSGTLELSASCVALAPGERLLSISPEGQLWLASSASPSASVRVVDLELGSDETVELAHAPVELQAWDSSRAIYLADDRLWLTELDEGLTEPLYWPETLAAPTGFCGDPSVDGDGFVVADAALLQRDAGLWWRWVTPQGQDFGPIAALGRSYGACVDRQGALWLRTAAGEVWRVSANDARVVDALAGAERLVFDDSFGGAGLLADQMSSDTPGPRLIYGTPEAGWIAPEFAAGSASPDAAPARVTAIAASAGRLWVAGEFGLLGFADGEWREVLVDGAALAGTDLLADELLADAGAPWIVRYGELCRLSAGPSITLADLRPLQRLSAALIDFAVLGPAEAGSVEILVDGQLADSPVGGPPWAVDELELGSPGWHQVEIRDDLGNARTLDVELRLPSVGTWFDDIKPLAELHCAGINGCHGPEVAGLGRPVLSEYEGWVLAADAIRARVGLIGDMPPPANRLESWDAGEVSMILTWIEAGMPMGME